MSATVYRRKVAEFAPDPERHALPFSDGLTVADFTLCPRKNLTRSHWVGPTTCRCMTQEASP